MALDESTQSPGLTFQYPVASQISELDFVDLLVRWTGFLCSQDLPGLTPQLCSSFELWRVPGDNTAPMMRTTTSPRRYR
jgi:hypothetical protein